jgi:hypothetical protein
MKKEIVYTDKYALIISDEFIKKCYDWNNFELSDFSESMDVILAHLPLSNAPILEGLPLLPSLLQGEEKYKYTEEDMLKAMKFAKTFSSSITDIHYIQSLHQPSRPTHFECETDYDCCGRYENCKGCDATAEMVNLRIKTTTNSQGHIELVGKYI